MAADGRWISPGSGSVYSCDAGSPDTWLAYSLGDARCGERRNAAVISRRWGRGKLGTDDSMLKRDEFRLARILRF